MYSSERPPYDPYKTLGQPDSFAVSKRDSRKTLEHHFGKPVREPQDPSVTAWWHNIWLGATVDFFVLAALFAGLFGWSFSEWKHADACLDRALVADGAFDASKHCMVFVEGVGFHHVTDASCPTECDSFLAKRNGISTTTAALDAALSAPDSAERRRPMTAPMESRWASAYAIRAATQRARGGASELSMNPGSVESDKSVG